MNSFNIGLSTERFGVLFIENATPIMIPDQFKLHQVILLHETFDNGEPRLSDTHRIPLKFKNFGKVPFIEANQEDFVEYFKVIHSGGYVKPEVYHKWFLLLENNDQSKIVKVQIHYICQKTDQLPTKPFDYLYESFPFISRDYKLFSPQHLDLYRSLFNQDCKNFKPFFGPYYPLVCNVNLSENSVKGDGSNQLSILNSYSRFARILMSLNLGKCMMVVNFELSNLTKDCKSFELAEKIKNEAKEKLCKKEIEYQGHNFKFFSTSNSGLKGNSAIFLDATMLNFERVKDLLGSFERAEQTGGARKVASRIGLSMGTSIPSLARLDQHEVFILPKHIEDEFPITDGAGLAVDSFFEQVLEKTYAISYFELEKLVSHPEMKLSKRLEKDYKQVSAIQIRFLGSKGVIQKSTISLWNELKTRWNFSDSVKVILRNSMIKFDPNTLVYNTIDVLNVSGVQGGNIQRGIMSCLIEMTDNRKEMEDIFIGDLVEFLKEINENKNDPYYICNYLLSATGNTKEGIAKKLILAGHPIENYFIENVIRENIKTRLLSLVNDKISFKIKNPYCVSLLGVFDESLELQEDEVYIHCSKLTSCPEYSEIDNVLVYRDPLGYEGDIQKIKLKKNPQSEFLKSRRNVIVFGKSKKTAPLCYMASGDLDGDIYHIIFHPKILNCFKSDEKCNLDYTSDEIYKKFGVEPIEQAPVSSYTPLTINEIIDERIKMFTEKSQLGPLYNYTTSLREDPTGNNRELRQLASKLYADCIDSVKGKTFPTELITKVKSPLPDWYDYLMKRVKENSRFWETENCNPKPEHFISVLFSIVEEELKKVSNCPEVIFLDPDFAILDTKFFNYHQQWEEEFLELYSEWGNSDTSTFHHHEIYQSDKKARNKKRTRGILLENYEKNTIDEESKCWTLKFIGTENNLDILSQKAAFFMNYAHTKYSGDRKAILTSPFLYNCCLFHINSFKTMKRVKEFGMYPQVIAPQFQVNIKKDNLPITRTTHVE